MKLSIFTSLILCVLCGTCTIAQMECGHGTKVSGNSNICSCDENFAGPNPHRNCFTYPGPDRVITALLTADSCNITCDWKLRGDPLGNYPCMTNPPAECPPFLL